MSDNRGLMKKSARLTAAAIAALLCLTAVPALAKTFVNATGEWEFRYPNELVIRETSSTEWSLANFSLGRPRQLRDGDFRIDYSITATSIDSVQRLIRRLCTESDSGLEANECDETQIQGTTWARILRGGGQRQATELTVATVAGTKRFEATATIPDGGQESLSLGTVEAIFATFELSPTGGAAPSGNGDASTAGGVARTGASAVTFAIIAGFVLAVGGALRLAHRKL